MKQQKVKFNKLEVLFEETPNHWRVKWKGYRKDHEDLLLKTDFPHAVMNFKKKHILRKRNRRNK